MEHKQHIIGMDTKRFSFDKDAPPALRIDSGDEVIFHTEDANVSYITRESDIVPVFDTMYEACGGCNPITGPVFVNQAKKGDYLAIDILDVKAGEERGGGYSSTYPGFGLLDFPDSIHDHLEPRTKIIKIRDGKGLFVTHDKQRTIAIDLNPFVGTIGVAPKEDRRSAYYHGQDFGGNLDCTDIRAGTTVVLPCNVDGGLVSIGDVHAAQGDGEITGCALECRGEVRVRITRLRAEEAMYCNWPQANSDEFIGAVICAGGFNHSKQIEMGYAELVARMHRHYGFDKIDAYQLLNLVGKVRIGQALHNSNSCVVKIARKYLE